MGHGQLRIYLGAAPGVGKTFAMLSEGIRRQERGADVVAGYVNDHGRPVTHELIGQIQHCGTAPASNALDIEAILTRHPQVVLVDDLADHWHDVDDLLHAGIDVITTLGVEHIESLADVMTAALGRRPSPLVADQFLRRAEQIELVDMTPEALLRRIAHGKVFAATDQAELVSQWSSPETLMTLRRNALLWLADGLRSANAASGEPVVVAVTGAQGNDVLIRRAARLALRTRADLVGVHITDAESGLTDSLGRPRRSSTLLSEHRALLADLGGSFHELVDDDVPGALVEFAKAVLASRLVIGASRRSRFSELTSGSIVREVIRRAGPLEVHVIADQDETKTRLSTLPRLPTTGTLGRKRLVIGTLMALTALFLVTAIASKHHGDLGTTLSVYLLLVVASAGVGGLRPALLCAFAGPLLANWFLVPPLHTLRISSGRSLGELAIFLTVAVVTSSFVSKSARRSAEALEAVDDATILAELAAGRTGDGQHDLALISNQMRQALGLRAVELRSIQPIDRPQSALNGGRSPSQEAPSPETPVVVEKLDHDTELVGFGGALSARGQRLVPIFVSQLTSALHQARAAEVVEESATLREADSLKTALLQTVSHDLRTPLAGIKAAVNSLQDREVQWSLEDQRDFLAGIETNTDRLSTMVTNLLDFSRLQSGTLRPILRPTSLEEILPAVMGALGTDAARVVSTVSMDLPDILTDAPLLERVVANLVANALTWSPLDTPVTICAAVHSKEVRVQIIDRGPGISPADRARVCEPFERTVPNVTGSAPATPGGGVGLGLAIAGGLSQAIGATLNLRDTPGGGLTAELVLPLFDHAGQDLSTDQPDHPDQTDQADEAQAAQAITLTRLVPSGSKAQP
jgi:two-component system, OmpR family, sensor histidine kinase KdpD